MRCWLPTFPSCGSRPPRPQSCLGFACTAPRPARPCPRAAAQPQLPPGTHSETLHLSSFIQPASLACQLSRPAFRSERRCDKCEEDEPPAAKACLAGHRRCRQRCQDAKNLPTTHPHLCLPIHNEGLIHRSLSRQLSKHYSNPSFPLMQSRSSLKNAKLNLKRNGIIPNM